MELRDLHVDELVDSKRASRRDFLRLAGSAAIVAGTGMVPGRTSYAGGHPVKVGLINPYSGRFKTFGDDYETGTMLRLEAEKWMAGGRKIKIIKEDTRFNPSVGVDKARKLLDREKVDVIVGATNSAVAGAMRDTVVKSGKVWILGIASNDDITGKYCAPNVFRLSASSWGLGAPLGAWAKQHVASRVVVIYANYAYGQQALSAFSGAFKKAGGTIIESIPVSVRATDFSSHLAKIKTLKPEAVCAVLVGGGSVNFVKQFDNFGLKGSIKLIGTASLTDPIDILRAQGESARGIIICHSWSRAIKNAENRNFIEAFRKKYNKNPGIYAVYGWDNMGFLLQGLEKTGGDATPQKLIAALRSIKLPSPRGTLFVDPTTNMGVMPMYISEVKEYEGALFNVMIDRIPSVQTPKLGCSMA